MRLWWKFCSNSDRTNTRRHRSDRNELGAVSDEMQITVLQHSERDHGCLVMLCSECGLL
jgi:hypothetical protein